MDATDATSIPATSALWSQVAASYSPDADVAETVVGTSASQRRTDDGAQLRARLLRMIVTNEHSRKQGADAPKPR